LNQSYDRSYYPPAPVLEIRLGPPGERLSVGPLRALVDTGADTCVVPSRFIEPLWLPIDSEQHLVTPGGTRQRVDVYILDIGIGGLRLPGIEVAALRSNDDVILGHSVLNKLTVILDGPRETIEVRE
jgi:predicted aspartyl protease